MTLMIRKPARIAQTPGRPAEFRHTRSSMSASSHDPLPSAMRRGEIVRRMRQCASAMARAEAVQRFEMDAQVERAVAALARML